MKPIYPALFVGALVAIVACRKEESKPSGSQAPTASAAPDSTAALVSSEKVQWPHSTSDLKVDPKITWGALSNGFRFVLRPNDEPPGRLSLRLYIETGSLMETDAQQGLAHFLEHMAFNGTKNFAAGQMVEYFQKRGLGFGAHTNAHTSFRETVYKLEVPTQEGTKTPDPQTLADCLKVFRDVADGMLLKEEEINKERGVILSEKLARDTVAFRTMEVGLKFQLPDSLVSRRLPIGLQETISGAPRSEFEAYYKRWYRPERMTLVVVGQLDPAAMSKQVAEVFGSIASGKPEPDPTFGTIAQGSGVSTKTHFEKEAGHATITFAINRAYQERPDTSERRTEELKRELANRIVNRRFEVLAKQANAPILQAQAATNEMFRLVDSTELEIVSPSEKWNEAVAVGAQELKRARQFGFTDAELQEAKSTVLTELENAAKGANTRDSKELSNEIVQWIGSHRVVTDPVDDLNRVKGLLPSFTKEVVTEAFQKAWASKDLTVFAAGNMVPPQNGETLEAALNRGLKSEVSPPEEKANEAFAYTDFGAPGQIMKRDEVSDLQVTQIAFQNGIRLTLKKSDFKKDEIVVQATVAGGRLTLPPDKPGLDTYASYVFDEGGLGKHSVDDLKRLFAAVTASASISIEDDAVALVGQTTPRDLVPQLQLLCALLTDPGWRPEADTQLRQAADAIYGQMDRTPEGITKSRVEPWLKGQDWRFNFPDKATLLKRTQAEAKAWLEPQLKSAPLELAIVGDFDPEATIKAVSATFGALPQRPEPKLPTVKGVTIPPAGEKEFAFDSMIPKSILSLAWPTTDRFSDVKKARRLQLLAAVMSDRLRLEIREKLGDSYSPRAVAQFSDVLPGYGWLTANIICSAAQMAKATEAVVGPNGIAHSLSTEGVTDEELDRAKKPMLTALEEQRRSNVYWLTMVCARAASQPYRLDWARTLLTDFSSVTKADLDPLCREYLSPSLVRTIQVIPRSSEKTQTAPLPATKGQ